jgi:hypothetical protein
MVLNHTQKHRIERIIALTLLTLAFISISMVFAVRSSISSGYDVTTDYHGVDVPPETLVTATATTTDLTVTGVTFYWKDPDENIKYSEYVDTDTSIVSNIKEYSSSYTPDTVGDWGVQAIFHGPDGKPVPGLDITDKVAIRATSFFHVPEIQIVGTAGTLLSMMAGLGYYIRRKEK